MKDTHMSNMRSFHKIACSECGVDFYWSRIEPKDISLLKEGSDEGVCSDCKDYQRTWNEGYDRGHLGGFNDAVAIMRNTLIGKTFVSNGCKITIKSFKDYA